MEYVPPAFQSPYRVMLFAAAAHGWYQSDNAERERILGALRGFFEEWEAPRCAAALLLRRRLFRHRAALVARLLDLRPVRGRQPRRRRSDDPASARGGRRRASRPVVPDGGTRRTHALSPGSLSAEPAEREHQRTGHERRKVGGRAASGAAPGRRRRDGCRGDRARRRRRAAGARAGDDQRARLGRVLRARRRRADARVRRAEARELRARRAPDVRRLHGARVALRVRLSARAGSAVRVRRDRVARTRSSSW